MTQFRMPGRLKFRLTNNSRTKGFPGNKGISRGSRKDETRMNSANLSVVRIIVFARWVGRVGRGQDVEDVKFVFAWSQPCIEYANYLVNFSHPSSTKEVAWTKCAWWVVCFCGETERLAAEAEENGTNILCWEWKLKEWTISELFIQYFLHPLKRNEKGSAESPNFVNHS